MRHEDLDVLTVAEAAKELGLSERGVQDRLRRGVMHGVRIGERVWVVPRSEVEEWKKRGKVRPGRPRRATGLDTEKSSPST